MAERTLPENVPGGPTDDGPQVISTMHPTRPPFLAKPLVRKIEMADIRGALADGWSDFMAAPTYGLFFGGVYAVAGLLILAFLTVLDMPWMIIFLAVGFPLLGPFVAVGLYEVSRRRAAGEPLSWSAVLGVIFSQRERQLAWMAFVVLFIFWIWAYQIRLLIALMLGSVSVTTLPGFIDAVLTGESGAAFLIVGTGVGAMLAAVLFSVTVLSMPMLVDRDIDIVTAVVTSIQAVLENPRPMLTWAFIVTAAVMLAMAPFFMGLIIVLPVLGHATWRLYARVVTWREPSEA